MVPASGPLPPGLRDEILVALRGFMADAELSQGDLAKALGTSVTYISNLLSGDAALPAETRDELLRDANNWLDREVRAHDAQKPSGYVETRVARRLIDVAERLTERPDLAIAFGPAGIGKSTVADAICAEMRNATRLVIDDDCASPFGFRAKLAKVLFRRNRPHRPRIADLADKLRMPRAIKSCALLILDEAHLLRKATLTTIRQLHDQAGCSVLLLGTVDLRERVSFDDDPEFGQFSSRVGMRINLARELSSQGGGGERLFTVAEVRKLFSRDKLKLHPAAARELTRMANTLRGTLRTVERIAFWAAKVAVRAHAAEITLEHLTLALKIVDEELLLQVREEAAPAVRQAATG